MSTISDANSLTLPAPHSASRRRPRRRLPPSNRELWWAVWCAYAMACAADDFATGWPAHGSIATAYAALYWHKWRAARDGRPGVAGWIPLPFWVLAMLMGIGLGLIGVR